MTLRRPSLIIGAGEVGSALFRVLKVYGGNVYIRDAGPSTGDAPRGSAIHIAFPYSDTFVDDVLAYEQEYNARLVVVHSTVPVGTCDPHGWVHSPVRGRHPHLDSGLTMFTKQFGGERAPDAAEEWNRLMAMRDHAAVFERARDTEAGKLWELIQYGVQIRVTQDIYEWCEKHDVDPDVAYRQFAQVYNEGYIATGEPQFVRPVLDYVPGDIGGHCVIQNSHHIDHPLSEYVRRE